MRNILFLFFVCYLVNSTFAQDAESYALVVIGGQSTDMVEVVSLPGATANCDSLASPADEAGRKYGHKAIVFGGKLSFCGGVGKGHKTRHAECYTYDKDSEAWVAGASMTKVNADFGAAGYGSGVSERALIAGGHQGGFHPLKSSELFNGIKFEAIDGGDMLKGVRGHCLVTVDDTKILSIGGKKSGHANLKDVQVFDTAAQTWSAGTAMQKARAYHACVKMADCNKIVVMGGGSKNTGDDTTEIYDIDGDSWSYGPKLPKVNTVQKYFKGEAVLIDGKPTLVGGMPDQKAIYQLSGDLCTEDVSTLEWTKLETTLQKSRVQHTASLVPMSALPDACA